MSFEKFTNLYKLSKTLRFELKPVGNTQFMLEENNVFQKDKLIQNKYKKIKIYFDMLHRDFVKESLKDVKLSDLDDYYLALINFKKDSKNKTLEKNFKKEEKRLRKEIVAFFEKTANEWATKKYSGLKNKNLNILYEEAVFKEILFVRYGKNADGSLNMDTIEKIIDKDTGNVIKQSIFDDWKGFTGYFTKFFETRKNFYKDDGTSSAIATRIIDQNLRRFIDNIEIINFIKNNYPDFSFYNAEKAYGFNLETVCNFNFYSSYCLLQDGIDNYNKQFVANIKSDINFYKQKNKENKIPYLKTLDRQILSEKEKFIDEIENDESLYKELRNFLLIGREKTNILKKLLENFINNQDVFNLEKIYFSKKGFEQISRMWTNETYQWESLLSNVYKKEEKRKCKKSGGEGFSFPDFIPLIYLKKSLESNFEEKDEIIFWKEKYGKNESNKENIWRHFLEILKQELDEKFEKIIQKNNKENKIGYNIFSKHLEKLLSAENIEKTIEFKSAVKDFADNLLSIYQFSKYFAVEKSKKWDDSIDLDSEFYHHVEYGFFDKYYKESFEKIITPYNLLRNYLTKKPWENSQKWKLNFENSTLAYGWDKNKEADNFAIILRKDGQYFLALMKKGSNHLFSDKNKKYFEGNGYEKMIYKLLPGPNKMLPKVFFSKSNIDFFAPSKRVMEIRNHSSHTKSGKPQKGFEKRDFNISDCHVLIDFFKSSLLKHQEWKFFNFNFLDTFKYNDISEFYRDIDRGGYKISFQNISENYINEKNKNGELYLFQIKNKDWNSGSTGLKNLHTMYFENLFSQQNKEHNFIFKLNGEAEIFYRPKTPKDQLGYKKDNQGKNVVNHKRYNEDKTFFHVSMVLNRNSEDDYFFNRKVNKFLANNSDINIIGVDRGEKHLAYYSVINQKGEVLESSTLNNIIGGNGINIDYHQKLEEKAKKRDQEKRDWQSIEGIKDLKKGYISQVVRKLADLAIQYNAIIIFEDLNMRFKQIRGGIEKSIYQQLEKALIEKLNFLVNKGEKDFKKAGNLLRAYQLTAPFSTFKEMGKQTGILFYTNANYTSKIDPITGWRPNLYLKNGNAKDNKEQILKFSKIEFVNNRFEFLYDIKDFKKIENPPEKTKWTVCSSVERFRWNRKLNNNKGGYDYYENLTDDLKKLFEDKNINIFGNILDQIKKLECKGNEKFFSKIIFLFTLICQIRNTDERIQEKINNYKKNNRYSEITEKEIFDVDFILSPVAPFFDSRKDNGYNLPKNGDDNGAFNIARKGIIILNKISQHSKQDPEFKKYPDVFVSNTEWDNFVQD